MKKISLKDYDNIISLGENCSIRTELQSLGIRGESLPFDNIGASYIQTVAKIIKLIQENKFDIKDFITVDKNFINGFGCRFGHYTDEADEYFQKISKLRKEPIEEIFYRRFERFNEFILKDKNILIYHDLNVNVNSQNLCQNDFVSMNDILNLNPNNMLIYITNRSNLQNIKNIHKNILLKQFNIKDWNYLADQTKIVKFGGGYRGYSKNLIRDSLCEIFDLNVIYRNMAIDENGEYYTL